MRDVEGVAVASEAAGGRRLNAGAAGAFVSRPEPASSPDPRLLRRAAWILIFLAALVPRLYHVRSPFMNFADHNSAMYSMFARNYLDRGLAATKLGQVRNLGEAEPASFRYFAHHPPTISLLTAASFAAAGITETSARLLPVLCSALTAPFVFLLARRLLGGGWGALAGLLFAVAPGAVYYGRMLAHEAFVGLGVAFTLWAWCRFAETGGGGWWRAALAGTAATLLVDWPGFYLGPALLAASALTPALKLRIRGLVLSTAAVLAVCLAAVEAHILLLMGSFEDLRTAFSTRVFSTPELPFTWADYLSGIRESLGYSLTRSGLAMAAFGALAAAVAAVASAALRSGSKRPAAPPAGEPGPGVPPSALTAALAITGLSHHAIFSNACHFNRHTIYYLLPAMVILAAAGPRLVQRLLAFAAPRGLAAAAALAAAAVPLWGFGVEAPRQGWDYFNANSFAGWPLVGKRLHDRVPEGGRLLATMDLSNPQLLFYYWRSRRNRVQDPVWLDAAGPGTFLLADLNATLPPELEENLRGRPYEEMLNLALYDLGGAGRGPEAEPLAPAPAVWEPAEIRFGEAVEMIGFAVAPLETEPPPGSAAERYLGLAWEPDDARGRIVHASIAWLRREGEARSLIPDYFLTRVEPEPATRIARMWRLADRDADLAGMPAGEVVRHELDWFIGEWVPPGEYRVSVRLRKDGATLPISAPDDAAGQGLAFVATVRVGSP